MPARPPGHTVTPAGVAWRRPGAGRPKPARVHRRGIAEWPAAAGYHRRIALGLVGIITLTDGVADWERMGFLSRGLVDEPCHLATAVVVMGALSRWHGRAPDRWFARAMLSASVLIDLDHVPLALGSTAWSGSLPRPYTHALWVVAPLAATAAISSRLSTASRGKGKTAAATVTSLSAGAAWGVGAHFLRDVATAPIALWWPVASTGVQVPYGWYLMVLAVLGLVPRRQPGARASGAWRSAPASP
jgi:hypothetical protein